MLRSLRKHVVAVDAMMIAHTLVRRGSHNMLQVTSFEPDKKKRGRQEPFYEVLAHRLAELEVSLNQRVLDMHLPCPASLLANFQPSCCAWAHTADVQEGMHRWCSCGEE